MAVEGVEVDGEGDEASEDGAPGAAMGDDGAGDLVEREQEDDVAGEEGGEEAVVDGVGGEGAESEEVVTAARVTGLGTRWAMRRLQTQAPRRVPTMREVVRVRVSRKAGFWTRSAVMGIQ